MKKLLPIFLLLTSCEVEAIPSFSLLATPLGLTATINPEPTDPPGFLVEFDAFNKELYFSGYSVYLSTKKSDLTQLSTNENYKNKFAIDPRDVDDSSAMLLGHVSDPKNNFYHSISHSIMSSPTKVSFPNQSFVSTITNMATDGTVSLITPIPTGTTYYIAVYAYSIRDRALSPPSNIITLEF